MTKEKLPYFCNSCLEFFFFTEEQNKMTVNDGLYCNKCGKKGQISTGGIFIQMYKENWPIEKRRELVEQRKIEKENSKEICNFQELINWRQEWKQITEDAVNNNIVYGIVSFDEFVRIKTNNSK